MVITDSGNNLLPYEHQAITWTNANIISEPLRKMYWDEI